jgi:hypothetical protein
MRVDFHALYFSSLSSYHHFYEYKLTGDPENPTSPVFPFLPGSPFMENKKKA